MWKNLSLSQHVFRPLMQDIGITGFFLLIISVYNYFYSTQLYGKSSYNT